MPRSKLTRYFLAGLIFITTLASTTACSQAVVSMVQIGVQAPDFTLEAVHGGSYHLADLAGRTVLLSFINTQAKVGLATADPSRAQIVFLKSMHEQYSPKGLVVLIVDAARVEMGSSPKQDDLINFTYDWKLDSIPLLDDRKSATARAYGVSMTPVTFLIGADGTIQQRWDGFASASQLALSIEPLLGIPAFRSTDSASNSPTSPAPVCPGETQPQARFAGVGLARSFSKEIWVVDKGQPWEAGGNYPLQWIIIDEQNLAGDGLLTLQVSAHDLDSDKRLGLVNQQLDPLPVDEVRGLLSGKAGDLPKVFLLPITVSLEKPGCLQIDASVFREGSSTAIYSGQVIVAAK